MLIQPYQEKWETDFYEIKEAIRANCMLSDIRIEHIGSTAVKGLAAKPIIDIDIVYDFDDSFEPIKQHLLELGYYHNGSQGIEGREVFKRKNIKERHAVLDCIVHHLYVCKSDSTEFMKHISFRNFLIENESARLAYEKLKYHIAQKANQDKKIYALLKETLARDFIHSTIR